MLQYLISPYKCIPDYHAERIENLDFDALYAEGVRALLIDIDNTLVPYDLAKPDETLETFLASLRRTFSVVLISNNTPSRIRPIADALDVPCVFRAKKPLKRGFRRALSKIGAEKDKSLVIGDQVLTDVYGAKRADLRAALVHPIKPKTEKWYTKFNRRIERAILRRIEKKEPARYASLELGKR